MKRCLAIILLLLLCCLSACGWYSSWNRSPAFQTTYTVRPGDTLSGIAQRYGVETAELQRLNRVSDPRRLQIGTVLKIPVSQRAQLGGHSERAAAAAVFSTKSAGRRVPLGFAEYQVGSLSWPVGGNGGRLTSRFGHRRRSFHEGIDIVAPAGTPVMAAHDGQVVYSNNGLRGYGNLVVVQGVYVTTVYAHNRRNRVRRGQWVSRGQTIAEVGSSGRASTAHLHFETRVLDSRGRWVAVDPQRFY